MDENGVYIFILFFFFGYRILSLIDVIEAAVACRRIGVAMYTWNDQ